MDIYHVWCDLKPDTGDIDFESRVRAYLGHLSDEGLIAGYRVMRRKLGLGPDSLGEFHIMIEVDNMAQLEHAFHKVSTRADPIEGLHFAVNASVRNLTFALYRDFPDPWRKQGEEKF